MDHHGNTTDDVSVSTQPIRQLKYSCSKFYPNAPDNSNKYIYDITISGSLHVLDATKFVNDDYILACSLDNGQIHFMYGYQDPTPIVVNTELQSKKIVSIQLFDRLKRNFDFRY